MTGQMAVDIKQSGLGTSCKPYRSLWCVERLVLGLGLVHYTTGHTIIGYIKYKPSQVKWIQNNGKVRRTWISSCWPTIAINKVLLPDSFVIGKRAEGRGCKTINDGLWISTFIDVEMSHFNKDLRYTGSDVSHLSSATHETRVQLGDRKLIYQSFSPLLCSKTNCQSS